MTPRTEQILDVTAKYFDLQIEKVDLPDNVPGFLQPGPDPRYIFVNAHKPRSDQALTIAHELGHYVMHLNRPPWNIIPWYLKIQWKSQRLSKFSQMVSRCVRRECGPELQADFWAFLFLWSIGAGDDVIAIAEIYPKKRPLIWFTGATMTYFGIKRRIKSFLQRLFNPSWAQ